MKTNQNPPGVLSRKVDEGVTLSRHSILNQFILASMIFGMVAALVTLWRDFSIGIYLFNSTMNVALVVILCVAWFMRDRLSVYAKSAILFFSFLFIACKNMLLFGPHSAAIIFLAFCCMFAALILELRWTIVIAILISFIIPLRAFLHFSGINIVDQDFGVLLFSVSFWASNYASYFLAAFIVVMGVGQLRAELNKNFQLLRHAVTDLEAANLKLTQEIELKNAYADDLLVSNKKFEGLFEGSRDGVLLLNSKAYIIEANQAAIEMSGYSMEELKTIDVLTLVGDASRADAVKRFDKNIEGDIQPGMTEIEIVTKSGSVVPVEINSNLILADDEIMVLSTVRDISYRKIAENEKFNAALAAEECERERFSKDLHDDLGPVFSTLNLYLQTLSKKESDPSKREILNSLSEIVNSAVKQVREISHNLSPYLLRDAGLVEAIRTHLKKFQANGVDAQLETQNNVLAISHPTEIVIYRVLLELLNNTMKHAQATKIRIQLSCVSKEVIFNYYDNGRGFDPSNQKNAGIGLKNIENRVRALNGSLKFQSEINRMTIVVRIPL
ncbi:MAG: PAS domain S-box protein [Chryseolinea sp.]